MEILDESEISIRGRMKCFGENLIRKYFQYKISVDEYIQFFDKKWVAIADYMELEYKQHVEGDWSVFTVTQK